MQRQTAADAAAAKNSDLNPQATDESLAEKGRALQHRMRSQLTQVLAQGAFVPLGWRPLNRLQDSTSADSMRPSVSCSVAPAFRAL